MEVILNHTKPTFMNKVLLKLHQISMLLALYTQLISLKSALFFFSREETIRLE